MRERARACGWWVRAERPGKHRQSLREWESERDGNAMTDQTNWKRHAQKKVHGEREWCESGAVHRAGTSMIRKKERKRERNRSSGRGCGGGGTHRDCEIKSQGTVAFLNVNQTKITHTHRLSEINATEINHKPNIYWIFSNNRNKEHLTHSCVQMGTWL